MKISIATTATGIVVKDLATGQQLTWVDEVSISYSYCVGRAVTYLATYSDTTINVVAAPPDDPATPATPTA